MDDFYKRLKLLKQEDFVWLIYFFIVIFAIISNSLERTYLLTNNYEYKRFFSKINTTILVVVFIIYLYFVLVNFDGINTLKKNRNNANVRSTFESLIASLLFLFGGAYALIADYHSNTGDINIALF